MDDTERSLLEAEAHLELEKKQNCDCGAPLFFGQSECAQCEHDNQN